MTQDRAQKIIIAILMILLAVVSAGLTVKLWPRAPKNKILWPTVNANYPINNTPAIEQPSEAQPPQNNVNYVPPGPAPDIRSSVENAPTGTLSIDWLSTMKIVQENVLNGFFPALKDEPRRGYGQFYKVGTVTGDIYKGSDLYYLPIQDPDCDGPGCEGLRALAVILPVEGKIVVLEKYSSLVLEKIDRSRIPAIFTIANSNGQLAIPDLAAPERIKIKGSNYSAVLSDVIRGTPNETELKDVGKTQDNRTIYDHSVLASNLGSYDSRPNDMSLRLKNGEYLKYSFEIPFLPADKIPQIKWNDGTDNKNDYIPRVVSGCGPQTILDVISDLKLADLVPQGTTSNGETVYIYKDKNALDLKNGYEAWGTWSYSGGSYNDDPSNKPSYEEYLKMRPAFIWKDPFGRLIRWGRTDIQPMGECGKPVVYLYPEKTEQVSVKLGANIEVTKSEPEYGKGWTVTAEPNGKLTTADGKTFPYLYWDGTGASYEKQTTGFVVASKDIETTLKSKLSQLGLNEKEVSDFNEFWVPIVSKSPYALISFVPQDEWNKAAPLSISPAPDTVIRVFMDWKPLATPVSIEPQILPPTPSRTGFTAVEWGGLLYR